MQTTILTCDWCAAAKEAKLPVFAVGTYTLQNGKPRARAPRLDLCARCGRELERYFVPRKKERGPYNTKSKAHKEAVTARAAKFEPKWKEREAKVLAALKTGPEGLKGPELVKVARLSKHYVYKVTSRLIAAGKVRRVDDNGGRQGFVLA